MVFPVLSSSGIQFLGDRSPGHWLVHDLTHAKVRCQIAEVICAGTGVRFDPDTLAEAHREGYDDCVWCMGESTR